jgi:hypothetical protein
MSHARRDRLYGSRVSYWQLRWRTAPPRQESFGVSQEEQ